MSAPAPDRVNVVFYDVRSGSEVSSMPVTWLPYVPRVGETLALARGAGGVRSFFKVVGVTYDFAEAEAGGRLSLLTVSVDIEGMSLDRRGAEKGGEK